MSVTGEQVSPGVSACLNQSTLCIFHNKSMKQDIISEADDVREFEGDVGLIRNPQVIHKGLETHTHTHTFILTLMLSKH